MSAALRLANSELVLVVELDEVEDSRSSSLELVELGGGPGGGPLPPWTWWVWESLSVEDVVEADKESSSEVVESDALVALLVAV